MRDLEALRTAIGPGRELVVLDETTSTSDEAKARSRAGAGAGLVVVADRQSAGRGRVGRAWHSPPGAGLYLSTLVHAPPVPTRIPLACAVACAEALGSFAPGLRVKWPNDVLARDGRKLAGILCEGVGRMVVVGIGLNVAQESFPDELAGTAVSLRMLGASVDRTETALALLAALDDWLPRVEADWPAVKSAWLAASPPGRRVTIGGREGTAVGLDDDGALVVDVDGARERVVSS